MAEGANELISGSPNLAQDLGVEMHCIPRFQRKPGNWSISILARLCFLIFGLVLGAGGQAYSSPLRIGANETSQSLDGHIEILRDPEGRLAYADVSGAMSDKFKSIPGYVADGFQGEILWARFQIQTRSGPNLVNRILEIEPPILDELRIFIRDQSGATKEVRLGDHYASIDRPIVYPSLLVPLELQPNSLTTIYIRLSTSSSILLRPHLWSAEGLLTAAAHSLPLIGIYLGVAFTLFILHLTFWLWMRDRVHLAYAMLVFCCMAIAIGQTGLAAMLLPTAAHRASDLISALGLCLALTCNGLFTMGLFRARRDLRVLAPVFYANIVLGLVGSLIVIFAYEYYDHLAPIALFSGMALNVTSVILSVRMALKGHRFAVLRAVAFLPSSAGLVITASQHLGFISASDFHGDAFLYGSFLQMMLMTLSLVQQARISEMVRFRSRTALLRSARRGEKRAEAIAEQRSAQLAEAVRELERALGSEKQAGRDRLQFIDMVSHEYRTPLHIMRQNLTNLTRRIERDGLARLREPIARMTRAGNRLEEVINVAQQWVRLEHVEDIAEPYNLIQIADCVIGAAQQLSDRFPDRTVTFSSNMEASGVAVLGDPLLLAIVFNNVLDNALKYSQGDIEVRMDVDQESRTLEIRIADDGIGIPAEDLPKVFDRFARSSAAMAFPGHGTGLALCRRIIELHKGAIALFNAPDRGAIASITLPLPEAGVAALDQSASGVALLRNEEIFSNDNNEDMHIQSI